MWKSKKSKAKDVIDDIRSIKNVEFDDHFFDDIVYKKDDIPLDYNDDAMDIKIDYEEVISDKKEVISEKVKVEYKDGKTEKRSGLISTLSSQKSDMSSASSTSKLVGSLTVDKLTEVAKESKKPEEKTGGNGFFKSGGDL